MSELQQLSFMALGGILFALGGTTWKGYRRYGLPLVTYFALSYCSSNLPMLAISTLSLSILLHLGYGESVSYPERFGLACLWSLASMVAVGFNVWQLVLPIAFVSLFFLSNLKQTEGSIRWKMVEFIVGVLIVLCYIGNLK